MRALLRGTGTLAWALPVMVACQERATPACTECGTVVVAAVREPTAILPPLVLETVGRDIGDRVFERLAVLRPGAATIDPAGFAPALAERWERVDSLAWRFTLRAGARWHDGTPVTADDVAFSFAAYADTALGAMTAGTLDGVTATAVDARTVEVRFPRPGAEQLYDATYHVRILPRHVWGAVPRAAWAADTAAARLVGSGPYRVTAWRRGESVTLDADTARAVVPAVRRLVWRFAADPEAALNLVLAHEADVLETVGGDEAAARVAADSAYRLVRYPSAVYGFAGFNLAGEGGAPHPLFGDRAVRRALVQALDRATLARALVGEGAAVPAGPVSRLPWIGGGRDVSLAFDTAAAARALEAAGWIAGADGVRMRDGRALAFDVLVPATSVVRKQVAEALQAAWGRVGARVGVTAVDFPLFQQRLGEGRFDVYVGAYLDEPSPRGLVEQWTARGIGALNHGRWVHPGVEALMDSALAAPDLANAKRLWRAALDSLVADAPAAFLYTPEHRAAVHRRLEGVTVNPYSWLEGVEGWAVNGAGR